MADLSLSSVYVWPWLTTEATEDPNTGLALWESGATIPYLTEQYDTEKKLAYTTFKEKHLLDEWLMFQMSQQG